MKITEIKIKERIWNKELEKYEEETNTYTRKTYEGDFDWLVLENTPRYDVINYASEEYDLIDEDDCDCKDDLYNTDINDITAHMEELGYIVFKTQSITEAMQVKKLKEALSL